MCLFLSPVDLLLVKFCYYLFIGILCLPLVLRVHKEIQRKGVFWKSGQKIKVLKGACPGCHKNNMYATLECIVLEGFQGDSGGK